MNKQYTIGVSSGLFGAAQPEERIAYAGISQKAFYGALKGVEFTQIDLESVTEFKEPGLQEKIKRLKQLGIRFGIHGESYAMGGREVPLRLDSAIMDDYKRSHERLLDSLKGAGEIGAEYFLLHASESLPFLLLWREFQPFDLVDIWGRPFKDFLEQEKDWVFDWILNQDFIKNMRDIPDMGYFKQRIMERMMLQGKKEFSEKDLKDIELKAKEEVKEHIMRLVSSNTQTYGAERLAYYITAKWMERNKDPLWINIAGENNTIEDKEFREKHEDKWVPAVASKYIWGHFNPETCPSGQIYDDPKQLLEIYKLYFVFETGMAMKGYEKLMRLSRPLHMIYLSKQIPSKYFGVTMDFEHMLGADIDPEQEIKEIPDGMASFVKVLHLGWPISLQPAHMPIPAGSDQQLYIYKRLYELRKKGFKSGYLIFERGGGKDPIQKSIGVLRKIVEYLEKDTPPDKLPDDFFGVGETSMHSFRRQWNIVFEHAFDPLKGLITHPEEEHTFLGKAALGRGKRPEEWKKEELR